MTGPSGPAHPAEEIGALAILTAPGGRPKDRALPPFRFVDPATPQVSALDLGVTRGDGIFEGISAVAGQPQALDAHLRRFERSAAALDLPAPDLGAWRAAIVAVSAAVSGHPQVAIKAVYTRGIEGAGAPTGWVYGSPVSDFSAVRTEGLRVITLDRGYRHDVASTSPWLLQGAKTLSYAINTAAIREAKRRGADDVIFVSSDGYVLEGPTSSVLIRRDDRITTPGTGLAILEGTTQGSAFEFAASRGFATGFELSTVPQLRRADALWLVSSGRHAAPIRALDGTDFPVDTAFTADLNRHLAAVS